jgi:AraC-like DNA-binding protein
MSESQLYRKLRAITDKSTAIFIRHVRLEKAKELLKSTDKTVAEVAFETGFNDPNWFSKVFKEAFGMSPTKFRN